MSEEYLRVNPTEVTVQIERDFKFALDNPEEDCTWGPRIDSTKDMEICKVLVAEGKTFFSAAYDKAGTHELWMEAIGSGYHEPRLIKVTVTEN